ncbi:MAG: hypothetical protein QXK43_07910 [Candidatus Jordarchaeales archaeon]
MSERPLGVSLIGVLYLIVGALFAAFGVLGVLSVIGSASELSALPVLFLLIEKIFFDLQGLVPIFRVVFLMHVLTAQLASEIILSAILSFLLLPGTVMVFVGGGLLKMFNWARKIVLFFSVAAILVGVLLIFLPIVGTAIGLLIVLFSVLVLVYMTKPEVEALFV